MIPGAKSERRSWKPWKKSSKKSAGSEEKKATVTTKDTKSNDPVEEPKVFSPQPAQQDKEIRASKQVNKNAISPKAKTAATKKVPPVANEKVDDEPSCSTAEATVPTEVSLLQINDSLVEDDITLESGDIFTIPESSVPKSSPSKEERKTVDDQSLSLISPPFQVRKNAEAQADENFEISPFGEVVRVMKEQNAFKMDYAVAPVSPWLCW